MPKYQIDIHYATGDSFGLEDCIDSLELTWENLDVAKDNLKRIKEHYAQYEEINSYSAKRRIHEILEANKNERWFVYDPKFWHLKSNRTISEKVVKEIPDSDWEYRPDKYMAENCLRLVADNGNEIQMNAFWCGHFEQLHSVKITTAEDPEMKFEV